MPFGVFPGRICCQFAGLIRSNLITPTFQSSERPLLNINYRSYSRKSNAAKRAKKAEERALAKQERRFVRTAKIVKPFPVDDCALKEPSLDDVWFKHLHPFNKITFEEAISFHRESVHETVYNNPGAFVNVVAVLNLKTKKQNVLLDKLKGSYMPAHIYPTGNDLQILALCSDKEDIEESLEAGAALAGGLDLIKKIEEGIVQVEEYDAVVAHSDIITKLAPIRGLMKTKMPKAAQGTLGRDLATMITKVKESRSYNLVCDNADNQLGWVDDPIGKLNMSDTQLRENMYAYLEGILKQQPRLADTPFISKLFVRSPSTDEVFLLNLSTVLTEEVKEVAGNKKELVQELVSDSPRPMESPVD